ncbi:MAG: hypothetical protein ACKVP7_11205 [Hyphomicrobiaceae bacterium]
MNLILEILDVIKIFGLVTGGLALGLILIAIFSVVSQRATAQWLAARMASDNWHANPTSVGVFASTRGSGGADGGGFDGGSD